jgi:DNA-binding XRE family transcriptional regulator
MPRAVEAIIGAVAAKAGRIRPSARRVDRRIGRVVRRAREDSALTQEQLAAACGLSRRSVIAIENGGNCRLTVLIAVIERLPDVRRGLARLLLR